MTEVLLKDGSVRIFLFRKLQMEREKGNGLARKTRKVGTGWKRGGKKRGNVVVVHLRF